jgi:hypothetical protein
LSFLFSVFDRVHPSAAPALELLILLVMARLVLTFFASPLITSPVFDEDQMAMDFVSRAYFPASRYLSADRAQFGFLENLVKVFPGLSKRPLHLTGESYAGVYIVSVCLYWKCRTGQYHSDSLTSRRLTSI